MAVHNVDGYKKKTPETEEVFFKMMVLQILFNNYNA